MARPPGSRLRVSGQMVTGGAKQKRYSEPVRLAYGLEREKREARPGILAAGLVDAIQAVSALTSLDPQSWPTSCRRPTRPPFR